MKDYVYAVVRIQPKLGGYCEKTDDAIGRTGLNICGETAAVVESMERLIDLKRRLVNLSVIYREMVSGLAESELFALKAAAAGDTLSLISESLGISVSSAARLLWRIKSKCGRVLTRFGIDEYGDVLV